MPTDFPARANALPDAARADALRLAAAILDAIDPPAFPGDGDATAATLRGIADDIDPPEQS